MKTRVYIAIVTLSVAVAFSSCQVGGNGVVREEEPLGPAEQNGQGPYTPGRVNTETDGVRDTDGDTDDRNGIRRTLEEEGLFDDWDTNGDGLIDPQEFSTNMFEMWDSDNDDGISRSEWEQSQARWFEDTYEFDEWDTDGNGVLSFEEFDAGVRENNVLDAWDGVSEGNYHMPSRVGVRRSIGADWHAVCIWHTLP
ncbi:MAG: hypothetical protein GF331_00340 [Chitinivibrionales bacterium]|nr:hypothetical protein [Chitinivibrionales bacterium]